VQLRPPRAGVPRRVVPGLEIPGVLPQEYLPTPWNERLLLSKSRESSRTVTPSSNTLERGGSANASLQGVRLASTPQDLPALRAHAPERRRARLRAQSSDARPFRGAAPPAVRNKWVARAAWAIYYRYNNITAAGFATRVLETRHEPLLARHPGAAVRARRNAVFRIESFIFLGFDWCFVCGSL